jgi:hypothetical protein
LVVKNFMQDHPQWRLLNDTIVKEVTIGAGRRMKTAA